MEKETERTSRPISGVSISLTMQGEDIHGQRFIESGYAFPVRRNGAVLDTVHQLVPGTALELINMGTNRSAVAHVKSMGPKTGLRQRVLVEVEDMENFLWATQVTPENDQRKTDAPVGAPAAIDTDTVPTSGPVSPVMSTETEQEPSAAAAAPATAKGTPGSSLAVSDRFMEALNELVKSALEANLRPAVEPVSNEIQRRAEEIEHSVIRDLQEMIENIIVASVNRLIVAAAETTSSQEERLTREIGENVDKAEQAINSRQEEAFNALLNRAQQVERELVNRHTQLSDEAAGRFSSKLEESLQQALADYEVGLGKRLETVESTLASRPKEWESVLTGRIASHVRELAGGSLAELQRQLEEASGTLREKFIGQVGSELNEAKDQLVQQTRQLAGEAARQSLNRMRREMVRVVKEMGEALENSPEGTS